MPPVAWVPAVACAVPNELCVTCSIISFTYPATCAETGSLNTRGEAFWIVARPGAMTCCTRYGYISLPPFAMAAENIASCRGDISSLNWPMAENAVKDGSVQPGPAGNEPGVTWNGMLNVLFTPNNSAWLRSAGALSRMPSLAKAVLQDSANAS